MRVVALHEDVLVCTSAFWQTTCTIVRGPDHEAPEAFVIDSPVLPDELEALPGVLEHTGWPCSGLLATHGDWDHLLGRLAFPDAALGCAETTAARLTGSFGEAVRELREFDDEHYVERRRPLQLGQVQALPVPGKLEVGGGELELHPTEGHVPRAWRSSPPGPACSSSATTSRRSRSRGISEGGTRSAYRATLERLLPLAEAAEQIVPGHGAVLDPVRAAAILREDLHYLETGELPLARRSPAQKKIDAENRTRW